MTITKSHLGESIRRELHLSKRESSRLVDSLLEIIKGTLGGGEDVLIRGFGKFSVKKNTAKKRVKSHRYYDVDPNTKRMVTFTGSSVMRDIINGKRNRAK